MTTDEPVLLVEKKDGLARVTLNRPRRLNSLDRELQKELRRAFLDLSEDRTIRVIHLTAAGEKAFCAGADLKESETHDFAGLGEFLEGQPGVWDMMQRCPQVIVSEVNGWAIGGGLQLALFSDLVYASQSAAFKLTQVSLGLVPPYGTTVRLARHIGQGRAMRMIMLGSTMTADEALSAGLVQGVEPDAASLSKTVDEVIQQLLSLPPESLLVSKNALVTGWDMSAEAMSAADRFRSYSLKQSSDTKRLHTEWAAARQ
ncbi:enoyl-CoA hydratase/isomerase family protein [Gordonia sp. LSe1-13]|uniref:Enoyl-CoA hydratase/isomerase family protein n=1 Tax=Gordonia sesuvii TaxID=3116777 RepID=A0ABU7MIZ7_9ACTN|nr:enoyl-CoA hydratase/isomerase family protein [Gordonia sp. LSe1-13]